MAEIRRLEARMKALHMDPVAHEIQWDYFFYSKALVLEASGNPRAALEVMRKEKMDVHHPLDAARMEREIMPGS